MLTQKITQAQVDYVLAHINDRPRRKVAEAAGICMSTMYRIVREHGGGAFTVFVVALHHPQFLVAHPCHYAVYLVPYGCGGLLPCRLHTHLLQLFHPLGEPLLLFLNLWQPVLVVVA